MQGGASGAFIEFMLADELAESEGAIVPFPVFAPHGHECIRDTQDQDNLVSIDIRQRPRFDSPFPLAANPVRDGRFNDRLPSTRDELNLQVPEVRALHLRLRSEMPGESLPCFAEFRRDVAYRE